jgi:hypothetical protein
LLLDYLLIQEQGEEVNRYMLYIILGLILLTISILGVYFYFVEDASLTPKSSKLNTHQNAHNLLNNNVPKSLLQDAINAANQGAR